MSSLCLEELCHVREHNRKPALQTKSVGFEKPRYSMTKDDNGCIMRFWNLTHTRD